MDDDPPMSNEHIIVRIQEYAQTTKIDLDEQNTFRLAALEIKNFLKEFPDSFKAITKLEKKAIEWRRLQHSTNWLSWYMIKNRNSAYALKAKLRRCLVNFIHEQIADLRDKVLHEPENLEWIRSKAIQIEQQVIFARREGIFDSHLRHETGRWKDWHANHSLASTQMKSKHKNKCKRETPNRLPSDWKEKFAKEMEYDPAIDLYICAGNRPSEVHTVRLSKTARGQLVIGIFGSKISKQSGQVYRELMPNMQLPAARRLADKMHEIDFHNTNLEALRARMARSSMRMWGVIISPGCYRHDLAGQVKALDGPLGDRVSKLLGQKANGTASQYGTRTGKSRGPKNELIDPLVYVATSEPVRDTRSMRFRGGKDPTAPKAGKSRK